MTPKRKYWKKKLHSLLIHKQNTHLLLIRIKEFVKFPGTSEISDKFDLEPEVPMCCFAKSFEKLDILTNFVHNTHAPAVCGDFSLSFFLNSFNLFHFNNIINLGDFQMLV
jgi:hypothetical protein